MLNARIAATMKAPGVTDKLTADGTAISANSPQKFQAHINAKPSSRAAHDFNASGIRPE